MKFARQNGRGSNWQRASNLRDVIAWSETTEDIGYNLADFLDHVNFLAQQPGARAKVRAAIRDEPRLTGHSVQDAYLAAVAAHLARRFQFPSPRWTWKRTRRLRRPWFALPDAWARAELLRDSPAAFRERNIFTTESALFRV